MDEIDVAARETRHMATLTLSDINQALEGTGWASTIVQPDFIRIWDEERPVVEVHRMPKGWLPARLLKDGITMFTHPDPEYRARTGTLRCSSTISIEALAKMPVTFYPTAIEAVLGISKNEKLRRARKKAV
jgi:hypothetical protein